MADDCDCCNPDDPCISTNCTFFEDNFTATIGSRISSYPNSGTPPGTITSSAIQSSSRGNGPPCWRVDTEINSEEGQYGDLFAINMTTWSWNPSSQGAITALRFCIDEYIDSESFYTRSDSTSKDPSIECWFIVKQGGKTYGCKISSLNTKAVWRKQYLDGIVQDDFEEIYSGQRPAGASVTNPSSHPDFTFLGGAITFGWAVHPEGPDSLLDIQTEAYTFWDNLCINVTHDAVTVDPGSPCQPTACDRFASKFSDVNTEIVTSALAGSAGGDVSATVSGDNSDGRNPPCIKIATTPPGATPNPKSTTFVFVLHKDAVSLADRCGIGSVSICADTKYKMHTSGSKSAGVMLACKQGGRLYVASSSVATPSAAWSGSARSSTQNDFSELYAAGSATGVSYYNAASHPDFTSSGGDIEFGVVVSNPAKTTDDEILLDNLCVKTTSLSGCDMSFLLQAPASFHYTKATVGGGVTSVPPFCTEDLVGYMNSIISSPIILSPKIKVGACGYFIIPSHEVAGARVRLEVELINLLGQFVISGQWRISPIAGGLGYYQPFGFRVVPPTMLPSCGQSHTVTIQGTDPALQPPPTGDQCIYQTYTYGDTGSIEAI